MKLTVAGLRLPEETGNSALVTFMHPCALTLQRQRQTDVSQADLFSGRILLQHHSGIQELFSLSPSVIHVCTVRTDFRKTKIRQLFKYL